MRLSLTRLFLTVLLFTSLSYCCTLNAQVFWQSDSLSKDQLVVIDTIVLLGNKVTKNKIVLREIIFHTNDTLKKDVLTLAAKRSFDNLMNTSLFNFVEIHLLPIYENKINVTVILKERWYIFPLPILEIADRNFNEWLLTKDFSRINYGIYVNWNNFRGMKEVLRITLQGGYSQRFNLNYTIPFINKNQRTGLTVYAGYNRNHEISYNLEESKLVFYKDEYNYVRRETYGGLRLSHRHDIYTTFSFFGDYRYSLIEDSVVILNPDYFVNNSTFQQAITLGYNYRYDNRDLQIYATNGILFEFEVGQLGLGILKNEPSLVYMMTNFRNYIPFATRWNFNYSIKGRLNTLEPAPFYNQKALGYGNDYVRGYEYYVVNGQSYLLGKSAIRYNIIKPSRLAINAIPAEKFNTIPYALYADAFLDFGYVKDNQFENTNPLSNTFIPGFGIGIDFISYYNIVARFEYSYNRYGESGLFLHMGSAF